MKDVVLNIDKVGIWVIVGGAGMMTYGMFVVGKIFGMTDPREKRGRFGKRYGMKRGFMGGGKSGIFSSGLAPLSTISSQLDTMPAAIQAQQQAMQQAYTQQAGLQNVADQFGSLLGAVATSGVSYERVSFVPAPDSIPEPLPGPMDAVIENRPRKLKLT